MLPLGTSAVRALGSGAAGVLTSILLSIAPGHFGARTGEQTSLERALTFLRVPPASPRASFVAQAQGERLQGGLTGELRRAFPEAGDMQAGT